MLGNSWELMIAVSSFLTGLFYVFYPAALDESATAAILGSLTPLWGAMYLVSSAMIIYGLVSPLIKAETIGLYLFIPAAVADGISLAVERGPVGYKYAVAYIGVAMAAAARAHLLVKVSSRKLDSE